MAVVARGWCPPGGLAATSPIRRRSSPRTVVGLPHPLSASSRATRRVQPGPALACFRPIRHAAVPKVVARAAHEDTDALLEDIGGTAIYLVGMMGSGKSTVGRLLAETLQYRFFDTDDVIEKSLGATVSQIFEENGEEVFRDIETKVLQELSQYARSVISTGGGAVLSRENWGNMRHGIVVWLSGKPETLASRIQGKEKDSRPLLSGEGSDEALVSRLEGMLEDRTKFYEEADLVVDLEDAETGEVLSPERMSGEILEKLAVAVQEKKREVEERKDFTIEGDGVPESMQVREPYQASSAAEASAVRGFGGSQAKNGGQGTA